MYNPPLEDDGVDWRAVASDSADIIDAKNEQIGLLIEALQAIVATDDARPGWAIAAAALAALNPATGR